MCQMLQNSVNPGEFLLKRASVKEVKMRVMSYSSLVPTKNTPASSSAGLSLSSDFPKMGCTLLVASVFHEMERQPQLILLFFDNFLC